MQEDYDSDYQKNEQTSECDNIVSNIGEEKPILNEESPSLITMENADFTNKSNMINSPRSLKACKELGVIPNELYQISLEEYKSQNPSSFTLEPKLLKYRYDGYEKFRNETISMVKKRRNIIISKENNSKKSYNIRKSKTDNDFIVRSLINVKERERKALENLKNVQRKNIKVIIEDQINKELYKKMELKKEWRLQKREEKLNKEKKENEMMKKKADDEINERKKKIEEQIQKKEALYLAKLKEQFKMEEEIERQKQIDYDNNQKRLLEENEKFHQKKQQIREKM